MSEQMNFDEEDRKQAESILEDLDVNSEASQEGHATAATEPFLEIMQVLGLDPEELQAMDSGPIIAMMNNVAREHAIHHLTQVAVVGRKMQGFAELVGGERGEAIKDAGTELIDLVQHDGAARIEKINDLMQEAYEKSQSE